MEITGKNDIGHDAAIEFCIHEGNNDKATGIEIRVQVKSKKSFLNKNCAFIKGDKEHFDYWKILCSYNRISSIKERRMSLKLSSFPNLTVVSAYLSILLLVR